MVKVVDSLVGVTLIDGHSQGVGDEFGAQVPGDRLADYSPAEGIEYHGREDGTYEHSASHRDDRGADTDVGGRRQDHRIGEAESIRADLHGQTQRPHELRNAPGSVMVSRDRPCGGNLQIACARADEAKLPAVETRRLAGGDEASGARPLGWLGGGRHTAAREVPDGRRHPARGNGWRDKLAGHTHRRDPGRLRSRSADR